MIGSSRDPAQSTRSRVAFVCRTGDAIAFRSRCVYTRWSLSSAGWGRTDSRAEFSRWRWRKLAERSELDQERRQLRMVKYRGRSLEGGEEGRRRRERRRDGKRKEKRREEREGRRREQTRKGRGKRAAEKGREKEKGDEGRGREETAREEGSGRRREEEKKREERGQERGRETKMPNIRIDRGPYTPTKHQHHKHKNAQHQDRTDFFACGGPGSQLAAQTC